MRSVSALLLGSSLKSAAVRPRAAGVSGACRVSLAMQALPISFLPLKSVAEADGVRACFFGMSLATHKDEGYQTATTWSGQNCTQPLALAEPRSLGTTRQPQHVISALRAHNCDSRGALLRPVVSSNNAANVRGAQVVTLAQNHGLPNANLSKGSVRGL